MNQENLKSSDFYQCSDLALAATISLWFPVEALDRTNPNKAIFLFKKEEALDRLLEEYWRGEVRVEPKAYFAQLKNIKSRLYSNS